VPIWGDFESADRVALSTNDTFNDHTSLNGHCFLNTRPLFLDWLLIWRKATSCARMNRTLHRLIDSLSALIRDQIFLAVFEEGMHTIGGGARSKRND
jgi:hypothetical protein